MHIKSVVISGFKTYRDKQVIRNLHEGHNVIIGRNGTGKSTFFDALQFVLSDTYSNQTTESRRLLLHDGAGSSAMTAYVEIVFDNSDGRFHVDSEEVVLRRTIGLKKDEYFLNRKRYTRTDVVNLLESAGFSSSNPYYIVQQNNAHRLCDMSDEDRLRVLKEVAGTRVYDQRRAESMKILKETDAKRTKIEEVIGHIEARIAELEEEKAELYECEKLDRQRRALDYLVANHGLEKARQQLEKLNGKQATIAADSDALRADYSAARGKLSALETQLASIEEEITNAKTDKAEYQREADNIRRRRTRLGLEVQRLRDAVDADASAATDNKEELVALERQIEEANARLDDELTPAYERAQAAFKEAEAAYSAARREQDQLYAKQGNGKRFNSKRERDAALRKEIKSVQRSISKLEGTRKTALRVVETTEAKVESDKQRITALTKQRAGLLARTKKDAQRVARLSAAREEAIAERVAAHKQQDDVDRECEKVKKNIQESERRLDRFKSRAVRDGLKAVELFVEETGFPGVHGPLIQLFNVKDDRFLLPIEVTANNQLFHVVVDDDEVAARLVQHLEERRAGRVTFMPLNRITGRSHKVPVNVEQAIPLMKKVEFAPIYRGVMEQVFGKTLLCRDNEIAADYAAKFDVDCVTMEGFQVNRRGALRGGFVNTEKSRLSAFNEFSEGLSRWDELSELKDKTQSSAMQATQKVSAIAGELQIAERDKANARQSLSSVTTELNKLQESVRTKSLSLETYKKDAADVSNNVAKLEADVKGLEAQLESPFSSALSPAEQRRLTELNAELKRLRGEELARQAELTTAEGAREELRSLLNENLLKRAAEVRQLLSFNDGGVGAMDETGRAEELQIKERELASMKKDEAGVNEKLAQSATHLQELKDQHEEVAAAVTELKTDESKLAAAIAGQAKKLELTISKHKIALVNKEENMRKIRDLGTLPAEEVAEYKHLSLEALHSRLRRVAHDLQKYSHVNKKAMEQFKNFTQQRESLLERKGELDNGYEAIDELIKSLDMRKNEAILRTFRQVSMHFAEVFKELVPEGKGNLVMLRDTDMVGGSPHRQDADDVSLFRGVGMKVWFGGGGEKHSSFSGGQKTMVALSLICAIQRCDPAPFYVFDEVDDHLDTIYAESVAKLLVKQAKSGAQVFTISFNPSVVQRADKCYAISFQHNVSNVHEHTLKQALKFVEQINDDLSSNVDGSGSGSGSGSGTGASARRAKRVRKARAGSFGDGDDDDGSSDASPRVEADGDDGDVDMEA